MNQGNSAIRGLVWKETRQLVPLVAILFGVGLFLIVLWQMMIAGSATTALDFAGQFVPLILPSLYAVGAAAVLVGQEKEQRTLWWLASLPTPPRRLILVKFAVTLAGLAVMWFGCALLTWLSAYRLPFADANEAIGYWFVLVHSLFLLLCGFYTAWRLQNAFISLLAIVPLAILPIVVTQILDHLLAAVTGRRLAVPGESQLAIGVTVVATVIVAWLGYRAANRVLQPADPDTFPEDRSLSWRDAWRPTAGKQSLGESYRFPIGSLLWQSVHHNRWVLAGLAALIGLGVSSGMLLLLMTRVDTSMNWRWAFGVLLPLAGLGGPLGVAWLGVFAFTGDGSASRLRFLADRGVSPTTAWLGRHLIGLSILATAVLLYAVLSVWQLIGDDSSEAAVLPSIALVAMLGWGVYSISQWTSQLIRLMAASAMVAPLLSAAVLYWFGFSAIELETPLWLLVVCGTLPMLTTWLMMRRFMDDNGGLQIWMSSLVTLGLIIVLPAIPLVVRVARFPEMPDDVRARLSVEARKVWQQSRSPLQLSLHDVLGFGEEPETERRSETLLSGIEALQLYERRRLAAEDQDARNAHMQWASDGAAEPVPISVDTYALSQLLTSATEDKLRFQSSPTDDSAIEALADRITLLTRVARGLRQSRLWIDQDHADLIEIWLTQTLSSEVFRPLLQRDFVRQAVDLISDPQARNHARRRAVLASWHSIQIPREEDLPRDELGGYSAYGWWPEAASSVQRWLLHEQKLDAVVDAALRLIEAGSSGMPTEPIRRELHRLRLEPSMPFVTGPYSDRLRIGSAARGVLPFDVRNRLFAPASQWYGPWEQDAVQLAKQISDSSEAATGETP